MTGLKDAREYLNGVEEIVEAKKDEVSEGGSVSDDDEEAWVMIPGMEAYKINPMENDFSPRVRNCYLVKKAKNADSATGE